jgi:hypothetical protein
MFEIKIMFNAEGVKIGSILFGIIFTKFGFSLPGRGGKAVPSGRPASHKISEPEEKIAFNM